MKIVITQIISQLMNPDWEHDVHSWHLWIGLLLSQFMRKAFQCWVDLIKCAPLLLLIAFVCSKEFVSSFFKRSERVSTASSKMHTQCGMGTLSCSYVWMSVWMCVIVCGALRWTGLPCKAFSWFPTIYYIPDPLQPWLVLSSDLRGNN